MALFDGYFDPSAVQGGGGGMIDRLLSQLQIQQQVQPSQGFQDQPTGTPENPVAVGDYQMPRIGGGFDAPAPQPDPAAIPQNAQPAQYQIPQAQPAPTLGPAPTPGGFGGAMRGFTANMQGGPLGMLAGGIAGAMGMGQGTPEANARSVLMQQYQSLIPVLGEQKARLAVLNPDAQKILLNEALTNKQKYVTIKDAMGAEHPAFVNEIDQTINGKPLAQFSQPGGTNGGLGNPELTGAEYLATLPKAQANTVQMMVEGKMPPPSSFALSKPYWQNMIAAAKNYDPTFDGSLWSGRVAGVKDFSAGKSSEMVRSANQTMHHVGALIDSMDNLGNGDYPILNKVGNYVAEQKGSGAQGAFRTNAHAVAEELSKVFKGSNLSDAEIHAWEQNLNQDMSPEQQRTQVAKLNELLKGSLHALEEKRLNSMGPVAAEKAGPLLKPDAQLVLDKMEQWIKKNPAPNKDGDAAPPKLEVGQSTTIGGVGIKKVSN